MPKNLSLKVSIVTEIPRVYGDFFFRGSFVPTFWTSGGRGAGKERERQIVQDRLGLSLRGGNRGAFPGVTMNVAPNYFQRKIEEK